MRVLAKDDGINKRNFGYFRNYYIEVMLSENEMKYAKLVFLRFL